MDNNSNRQKVFITGGAGFIGANLVKYLLDREQYDITVYDNFSACSRDNLDKAMADSARGGEVRLVEGDILDFGRLIEATRSHNTMVHLAAHTQVRESIRNPREHLAVNSTGTLNVLEAARKHNVDRFVFASSNATVGEQTPPINESMISKPISPYGAVKLYGEALCSAYYHSYGLKTVALRFANAYGYYAEHKTSVVGKFIKKAKQGEAIHIYGDGNQTRDFIHAEDICQAIYRILGEEVFASSPWGEVFQIATGTETRIIDLAMMILTSSNVAEHPIEYSPSIKGEIRKNFSDISKAREFFDFRPEIELATKIRQFCCAS